MHATNRTTVSTVTSAVTAKKELGRSESQLNMAAMIVTTRSTADTWPNLTSGQGEGEDQGQEPGQDDDRDQDLGCDFLKADEIDQVLSMHHLVEPEEGSVPVIRVAMLVPPITHRHDYMFMSTGMFVPSQLILKRC